MAIVINSFTGENDFLSNFYPCKINYNGIEYKNAEAAFQAQKVMGDAGRLKFSVLNAPSAKRLGQQVNLRQDWENVKDDIMLNVVRSKFTQNPNLAQRLLETGSSALIEGNTWGDRYWGVCGGQGQNKLGYILMYVRAEIEYESQTEVIQ